jgi:hypothetical protein
MADYFVNRTAEISLLAEMLSDRDHRILLLHGPAGIGKTSVMGRLRTSDTAALPLWLDLRDETAPHGAESLIIWLREKLGGVFAAQLANAEAVIQRDMFGVAYEGALRQGLAALSREEKTSVAETAAAAPVTAPTRSAVTMSGEVHVQGDVIGGDKIVIRNLPIIVDPAAGSRLAQAEVQTRRNTAFREALRALLAEQRIVLFIDHYEEATQELSEWLYRHMLSLHLDGVTWCTNLWIVVSGRRVPLEDEADRWQHVLRDRLLGPLDEEAIYVYWVNKRGLDPNPLAIISKASGGNPQMLYMMANNWQHAQSPGDT